MTRHSTCSPHQCIAVLCLAMTCLSRVPAADASALIFDTTAIEAAVEDVMKERNVPGCVVGVVVGDELAYIKPFGVANVETKAPMKADTLFQIGSVTKTFTATLMCILRDKGVLRIDDPISKYLPPELKIPTHPDGTAITPAHLATHTAGLPGNPGNRRDIPNTPSVMEPYSVKELYEALGRTTLASPPGMQWNYSNYGYGLLGHVLERAAAKKYEALLSELIFEPLGMKHSGVTLTDDVKSRLATHCWPRDLPRVNREPWIVGDVCAFGGIYSNAPDLAKYVSVQFRTLDPPPPFTASSLIEWQTPRHIINPRTWQYAMGLGWWVRHDEETGNIVAHGGEVDGHSSTVAFVPDHGVGIIVLSIVGADTADVISRAVIPHVNKPILAESKKLETYHEAEDWTNLRDTARAIVKRHPANGRAQYELGYASLMLGESADGAAASHMAAKLSYRTPQSYYNTTCGYARMGDKDKAFEFLRLARDSGFRDRELAMSDPDLETLRSDPRWDALLRGD